MKTEEEKFIHIVNIAPEMSQKAYDEFMDELLKGSLHIMIDGEFYPPLTPTLKPNYMHYRNGKEAKNGEKIVKLEGGKIVSFGVLHSATPGNDYCNGYIAPVQPSPDFACLVDCLTIEDIAEILKEKGLDRRPQGK